MNEKCSNQSVRWEIEVEGVILLVFFLIEGVDNEKNDLLVANPEVSYPRFNGPCQYVCEHDVRKRTLTRQR